MGGKARVHELAKEFGVPAKEVLARLAANGEWAKSASSTVEAGVARRLREAYGFPHPAPRAASVMDHPRAAGSIPTPLDVARGKAQRQRTVGATSAQPNVAGGKRQSSLLTSADAVDIYRRHRLATDSENPSHMVGELFRECEARYGISKSALRQLVASDKLRRLAAGEARVASTTDGVERSLRDAKTGAATQARIPKPQPGVTQSAVRTTLTQPKPGKDKGKRRHDPITPSVAIDIYKRYQRTSQSKNPSQARDALVREWEAKYGLTQKELRRIIASGKRRVPAKELTPRNRGNDELSARNQGKPDTQDAGLAGGAQSSPAREPAVIARPRTRTAGLPPLATTIDLEAVTDIATGRRDLHDDREAIHARLQQLVPNRQGEYGYLTWRYAATRVTHTDAKLSTAHQDLVALAVVIDQERRLLDALVRVHGSILTKPSLAERGLEQEFRSLIATDEGKRSPDAELRRTRAAIDFLRRAVVLSIASGGNGERLWNMLGRIQPSTSERAETSLRLEGATQRLTDLIGTVERLLSTDDANLAQFFLHSRGYLAALQLKRYDFLLPFRDSAVGLRALATQVTPDLAFQVLPQGEQLRKFLGGIRASKRYSGYRIDEHRLTVLEDLQKHFGAHRCVWHRGSGSSDGIGIRYLVLTIKSANGSGENAVAISPLAGRHATYVVRRECAEADWKTLFAHPKFEARLLGARKLLFTASTGHTDQYSAMRDKIIKLLECDPREFR
ncbi:translation initiation factor IF-2 N-terminal domain-containing protein [Mycolicibacterium fortuitum]|uniref:translation initiation factor IF-2 N-terminal domain-containing protein n=1 Tax=Mycolicibacterium fortuitum TaxID=1766 RepID=UPI001AEF5539|nr:translation initiation factor IF-2 N-terminal domain-containing protein [Mycolicibacterium fortuitum]